jgi:hypothetical protein|tara:strand:+ start:265 stop:510 length:246 start_codon:yes stop_codon:yes gene_type:complete
MIKKKINKRAQPVKDDDILEDGDFVMDGYSVQIPSGQSKVNIDDLTIDQDDYELQQEEVANGMESDNAEPIAVDRYFRRIR